MGDPGDHTTLVEVLAQYRAVGFRADFLVVEPGLVRCATCRADLEPNAVELHSLRRLEGTSDPADMAAVVALVCPRCQAHGTAVVRFGPEASVDEAQVLVSLRDRRHDEAGRRANGS